MGSSVMIAHLGSTVILSFTSYFFKFSNSLNKTLTLNDLTFLGTFEKYSLLMGIKYLTADTLTTFEQAEEIMGKF